MLRFQYNNPPHLPMFIEQVLNFLQAEITYRNKIPGLCPKFKLTRNNVIFNYVLEYLFIYCLFVYPFIYLFSARD
jgi:hypothetical protein